MCSVQRKQLCQLNYETSNAVVIGIIIGKIGARFFQSKDSDDFRGVVTFTIRDSKRYFTNCKFWGSRLKVEEYDKNLRIYDIVNIICPRVIPINKNSVEQQYQPITSTPFCLVVNEGSGSIENHFGDFGLQSELKQLKSVPIKPLSGVLNLADVNIKGAQDSGQSVDLLLVVKHLKPVRCVKTKSGQNMRCLEVIFVDKTNPNGVSLTIWENDWIERALEHWHPLVTVINLINVRVGFSQFYKSMVLELNKKTIIIENPESEEVTSLISFAQSLPLCDSGPAGFNQYPSLESITTIMTIQQIYDRSDGNSLDDSEEFSAVLYAMVSKFDLDGSGFITGKRCKFCRRRLTAAQSYCGQEQCEMSISLNHYEEKFDYFFNINVHLTDHTGTLIEARLSEHFAERLLKCSVEEFQQLSSAEKATLKWKFLLSQFAVKLVVRKKSAIRSRIVIILMELKEVQADEVAQKILLY